MVLSPQAFAALSNTKPMEAIRALAREWLSKDCAPFPGHGMAHGVPASLRWLHGEGLAVASQNEWIPERALTVESGRLVFYAENQGVCVWATNPEAANGPVWVKNAGESLWREDSSALDGFLFQAVLFETIAGAPWGGIVSWCGREDADLVCRNLTRLPLAPSAWLGSLYVGEDLLMTRLPNGDGDTLWIGARTEQAEDRVRAMADLDW